MQKALLIKIGIVLLLSVLLNIPLGMLSNLVDERQGRQNQVSADVANSYAEPQLISGPIMVFPYIEEYMVSEDVLDRDGNKIRTKEKLHQFSSTLIVPPKNLLAVGSLVTDIKKRSLFEVPVYTLDSSWEGTFEIPAELAIPKHGTASKISMGTPYISLPVSDPRGFAAAPVIEFAGKSLKVKQGSGVAFMPAGVQSMLDPAALPRARALPFKLSLKLRGTSQLKVIPVADNLRMELSSNWPHPGFEGRFLPLPESQQINKEGFKAAWEVSALASNAQSLLSEMTNNPSGCGSAACLDSFEIRLVNPVSIYHQAERALKYGFLFIGITFMAFFLFEMLKRLVIHPAHYTLVGLAQAMFFLLLLSISEHINFTIAYVIAAVSCVTLVGYYLGHVMNGIWRGASFALLLGGCYAALYGLLVSEDNSLLMGSLLMFVLLAAAMVATRKFDWYAINTAAISNRVNEK